MKDNLGNELSIGDKVVYIYAPFNTDHELRVGTIIDIKTQFGRERAWLDSLKPWSEEHFIVESKRILKLPINP